MTIPRIPLIYLPEHQWNLLNQRGDFLAELEINPVSLECIGGTLAAGQRCGFILDHVCTPVIATVTQCYQSDEDDPWMWVMRVRRVQP